MKAQAIAAVLATLGLVGTGGVYAQMLPPMEGPFVVEPAYPPSGAAAVVYEDGLLPQEIIGILESTGYAPLGMPVRRGRLYVVAVLHPDGSDGRLTMDALSGRFVRFVPAERMPHYASGVANIHPLPPVQRGLRPPAPLPKVAAIPVPAPKPPQTNNAAAAATGPSRVDSNAVAGVNRSAELNKPADAKSAEAKTAAATPKAAEVKSSVQLLPTQPMPPAQTFE